MSQPVRLALKNILWIPEIYPRSEVNQERIAWFIDLMSTGKHFPAIKVTEYDGEPLIFDVDEDTIRDLKSGEKYVLLDGKHRVEAYKMLGKEWIEAYFFNTPSIQWDFASARFNAEGPLNLVPGEWKKLIIRGYHRRIKAGRPASPKDIAEEIGGAVTIDYIRRVLKPFRDPEKKKLREKIVELYKEGFAQQKIADELGIGRKQVRNAITIMSTLAQTEQSRLGQSLHNSENISSVTDQEVSQQRAASAASSGTIHGSQSPAQADSIPEEAPETSETKHSTQPAKVIPFPETHSQMLTEDDLDYDEISHSDTKERPALNDDDVDETVEDILNANYGSKEMHRKLLRLIKRMSRSGVKYDPKNKNYNAAIQVYNLFHLEGNESYMALRVMELIKQLKWDFVDISEFLGQPMDFLRKVAITALGIFVAPDGTREDAKGRAVNLLGISWELADAVSSGLMTEEMLALEGEGIPDWVKDNLGDKDIELVAEIASTTRQIIPEDIPYLLLGKNPPRQRANFYSELPDHVRYQLTVEMHNIIGSFRTYRDQLNSGLYRGNALKEFIKYYNRAMTACNEVNEALINCRKRGYF